MKILFVFCEGPHDAHFLGRLLRESGQYESYEQQIKDYPRPLGGFIAGKFRNSAVDEIRIGLPEKTLVPVCAYYNSSEQVIVLPIPIGGMDKTKQAIDLLHEIEQALHQNVLDVESSVIEAFGVLFLFDADSRGLSKTISLFQERFQPHFQNIPSNIHLNWLRLKGYPLSVFVFTDGQGEQGTLEDTLVSLFRQKNSELVCAAETLFPTHFEDCAKGGDHIAHEAKKKKGILTTCGQMEKKNAGYALTVVLRDSALLHNAFDFTDTNSEFSKLVNLINVAFV